MEGGVKEPTISPIAGDPPSLLLNKWAGPRTVNPRRLPREIGREEKTTRRKMGDNILHHKRKKAPKNLLRDAPKKNKGTFEGPGLTDMLETNKGPG